MRVSCPACDAAYDIPDSVLGAGPRMLRCARCAHEWNPLADPPPPELETPTIEAAYVPEIDPPVMEPQVTEPPPRLVASPPMMQELSEPASPPRPKALVAAAWVASVAVLAGMGAAAYVFRDAVQSAWPPSQLLYAALGLG